MTDQDLLRPAALLSKSVFYAPVGPLVAPFGLLIPTANVGYEG